jgi:hypothetical protein
MHGARCAGTCSLTQTARRKAPVNGNNGWRSPARRWSAMPSSWERTEPDEATLRLLHAHCHRQYARSSKSPALLPASEPIGLA